MNDSIPHVAGPLQISDILMTALKECEAVLRSGLFSPEMLSGRGCAGPILMSQLEWVEQTIGARLPDELLALLSIGHPVAALATGLAGFESILNVSEEPVNLPADSEHAGRSWLRISSVYCEPFMEPLRGAHGGAYWDLCVESNGCSDEGGADVLVLEDGKPVRLEKLGRIIWDIVLDEVAKLDEDDPHGVAPKTLELDVPCIVDDRKGTADPATRRVCHENFGEGTVLGADGDGDDASLTIDFEAVGTKKIRARFIREL